jgi:hypothetical protein
MLLNKGYQIEHDFTYWILILIKFIIISFFCISSSILIHW